MKAFLLVSSWGEYFDKFLGGQNEDNKATYEVLQKVFDVLSIVLWVVLGIVGAIGAVYAIYLGVQLARAEDQGKRDDAKKHLITVFIAIGVTIALILVFNIFLPMLLGAFVKEDIMDITTDPNNPSQNMIQPLLHLLRA